MQKNWLTDWIKKSIRQKTLNMQYTHQQNTASSSLQCLNGLSMSHVLRRNPVHWHDYVIKPAAKQKRQQ